jgi:lipopolysaccharide export system protein LptA
MPDPRPARPARRPRLAAALLIAAAFPPAAAQAQTVVPFAGLEIDRAAPIEIAAEALEVDQAAGTAVFTGEVVIAQEGLRLSAARVAVTYAAATAGGGGGAISRLDASGGVTLVTPSEAAEAAEAVYDLDAGLVTLIGDVVLTQGGSALAGDRLVVSLETRTGRMEGRVRSVILPQDRR